MTEPTPTTEPAPGRTRRRRTVAAVRGRSVRSRVVAWVVIITTGGMVVAGTAAFLVQQGRIDARIAADLRQEVVELRTFSEQGVDPGTGAPFTTVDRFLEVALQRNVPGEHESFIAMLDGRVAFVPGGARELSLQDYPGLVEAAGALGPQDPVRSAAVETEQGEVRYAAVPVALDGDPQTGVFVIGYARWAEQDELVDSYRTFAGVAALTLVLVALVSWLVAGRLLRPVTLLRQTAQRITAGPDPVLEERIPVRGHDDVSELGRSFNAMLDRLQTVLAGQRRLLDDVGHELRTPITVVRGHVELMDVEDVEDVRATRDLALEELDRMHRLADDLVLLASAAQPDFLRWGVVDTTVLLAGVLERAGALADRRWERDPGSAAPVAGDAHRLTQALLALVSNAVRVTCPDDVIALGCSDDGGTVRLHVRDTGPGVPPQDHERIFERFARGSGSGRDDGSGLGLSIVSAIAVAHGGRVELESRDGHGATFTLALPHPSRAAVPAAAQGRDAT